MQFPAGAPPPVKVYPVNPEEGITFILEGNLRVANPESGLSQARTRSYVFGQPSSRQDLVLSPHFRFIHVRFEPGTLYRLFRLPVASELRQPIDAAALFGKDLAVLEERLKNAGYAETPALLDQFFRRLTSHRKWYPSPFDAIPLWMRHHPGCFNLAKMASEACMSERHFEKKFIAQVGVRPKLFARISRFYEAYMTKERQPQRDWLSVALDFNYNDYQHLVKDFRQFAGGSPNALLKAADLNPERRLQLAPGFVGV